VPPRFSREIKYPVLFSFEPPEYQTRTSPCEVQCPAGNAIQRTQVLIQKGQFEEALRTLRSSNPFPGITGRVCHHPCEKDCNRKPFDESVSIKALERAASDYGEGAGGIIRNESTGKRVAIIGGGPAGLTSAYFLFLLGHELTVFEASPYLGGIPRTAIRDDVLPKEVVDREAGRVLELGIEVRLKARVGKEIAFREIAGQYDACLIATGSGRPIGQGPDLGFLRETKGLPLTAEGLLDVDPFSLATGRPDVFAAGDSVTGRSSVAQAVGSGRRAAFSIHSYLQGERLDALKKVYVDGTGKIVFEKYSGKKRETVFQHRVRFDELMNLDYFEKKGRVKKRTRPCSPSARTLDEIDQGYDKEKAMEEAARCFHCGHCFGCGVCVDVCPGDVLAMADQQPQPAYPEECYHCGSCLIDCPASAISFHIPLPLRVSSYPEDFF
jgi:NADPH-dependent glutamate synthase beta subunit-like oxidoreductase